MGTRGALSLGVKRLGCEADYSSSSSAEVKECVELYLHSPNTPSWRGNQLKKVQGQLYLYLLTMQPVMKTYCGSRGIAPHIPNADTTCRTVVSLTPRSFYPRYPLDKRLGVPQSRYGRGGEEKETHHCPCRESNSGRSARSLATFLTELTRLSLLHSLGKCILT
jgi:hypothetical protein